MPVRTSVRTIPARRRGSVGAATSPMPDNIARVRTPCANCDLRELCPPCCGLAQSRVGAAKRPVFNRSRVRRGESLYRTGDHFTALYAVRSGFFKSTILLDDGRRDQVTGFSIAGEVLGMDGIGAEWHTCNAIALEDSDVCVIPFGQLQKLAQEIPDLQRQFHKMMSREMVREHGVMLLLGSMNAEERLAMFLLNLSMRFAAQGRSASNFNMRMTREEIGSFLGLSLETVSRILSKFQEEGLLSVRQKVICDLDHAGLKRVMGRELP